MEEVQELLTDVPALVRKFLVGEMDIISFRELYDSHPEINNFLQSVIDGYLSSGKALLAIPPAEGEKGVPRNDVCYFAAPEAYPGYYYGNRPHGSVREYLTQEFRGYTTNVKTASGAWHFYIRLYDVFYQYDQTVPYLDKPYHDAFCFALDVIPEYLSGGIAEAYIQEHIIPLFPADMGKTKRKQAIRSKIREEFRSEKGYPAWIQSSEWPLGANGKPAVYIGQKKKHGGELVQFLFRDESNGETIIVEQFH